MEITCRSHHLYEHFVEGNMRSTFLSNASGAFFGAFFAFIFGLIAYFIQKKFDRYHKHKYATVELEYLLQDHLDRSAANQFLLNGAIKTISKNMFSFTLLSQFRLPADLTLRLGDLALINRYADYQTTVTRINHSMQTWQKVNEKLHEAAVSGALTEESRRKNQEHLIAQAEIALKFLKGMDNETKHLVAYVRVFMRKDKYIWSIPLLKRQYNLGNGNDVVTEKETIDEKSAMEKEIKKRQKESREKIDSIVNS